MTTRKVISLSIMISFSIMLVSGVLSYLQPYSRTIATVHTVFGVLFSLGVMGHIINNAKPLKNYLTSVWVIPVVLLLGGLLASATLELAPFRSFMDQGARLKASSKNTVDNRSLEIIEMSTEQDIQLTVDLLAGEHYWHPQMAVWIEDGEGRYVETLFVSTATAKGIFYGGRSKDNFKEFDAKESSESDDYRRVDALPIWSHKRNVRYEDGMYAPTQDKPLPDGMTGATAIGSFVMNSSTASLDQFSVKLEINVAFDDNEYYSEFDFADDDVFHAGTGQLGQPSIVFSADVDMHDGQEYYLMYLIGHGHHSGQNGEIIEDLSTLTTALEIVERIMIKAVNK